MDKKYSRIEVYRLTSHLQISQASTWFPRIQSIQRLGCLGQPAIWGYPRLVLGIPGYKLFKDWGVQADQPSGNILGQYLVSWDTNYSRIGMFRSTSHLGTSQGSTCIPGYKVFKDWGIQANQPSGDIPGQYLVSGDTKYSRIGVSRPTSHLGISQASTWYPGIQSRIGVSRLTSHLGNIPGQYLVSHDIKYSRIGVSRPTNHLGTSQASTWYTMIDQDVLALTRDILG